jgi:inorganic pyrophosphatase
MAHGAGRLANTLNVTASQVRVGKMRVNPELFPFFHSKTMSLDNVTPGSKVPEAFNVIIEIPMNADPIKYEVDKETGAIFVDRFMSTAMHYPTNYGYVPKTISGDGDPVDVLVITPVPLIPGVVVPCRAIGILKMTDEAGEDGKVLAVPTDKILSLYTHWQKPADMNPMRLKTIEHFFEHYKDLEPGKWVKVLGWEGPEAAHKEILDGIAAYEKAQKA